MRARNHCIKFISSVFVAVFVFTVMPIISISASTIADSLVVSAPGDDFGMLKAPQDSKEYPVVINLWSRDKNGNTIYPQGTGGTASLSTKTLKPGQSITITVTPDTGYTVDHIGIGDGAQGFGEDV